MNNYFPLLGVAVCIGTAALPAIFNLFGRAQGGTVYKYSKGFRVFLWLGAVGILSASAIFGFFGITQTPIDWLLSFVLGSALIVGCIYTDKYHIALNVDGVEFGAFRSNSIHYNDITALRRIPGRTPILEIHTRDRAYSLSGNVQGFGRLCELLQKSCGKKFN